MFSAFEYKIVVVGSGAVGKSALTLRFISGHFVEKYDPTVEDFYRKQVDVDNHSCMLEIFDTAGQEEYSALRDQFMSSGQGYVLVYSVISVQSFDQVEKLRRAIIQTKEDESSPIVLIGNKIDLVNERSVSTDEGRALGKKFGVPFLEVSAKENIHVDDIFVELIRQIKRWRKSHPEKEIKMKKKVVCVLI